MRARLRIHHVVWIVGALLIAAPQGRAQQTDGDPPSWIVCARQHFRALASNQASLGIAPDEATALVQYVGDVIAPGSARNVTVIPCLYVAKAESAVVGAAAPVQGVPQGEYIFYRPQWVQEVAADNSQAMALFAHELGHIVGRHFTPPNSLRPRAELEAEADGFAGCVSARTGGRFDRLEDLLSRLRSQTGGQYPSRADSLAEARAGFNRCARADEQAPNSIPATIADSDTVFVQCGDLPMLGINRATATATTFSRPIPIFLGQREYIFWAYLETPDRFRRYAWDRTDASKLSYRDWAVTDTVRDEIFAEVLRRRSLQADPRAQGQSDFSAMDNVIREFRDRLNQTAWTNNIALRDCSIQ